MKIMLFTTGRVINAAGGTEKVLFEMANNLSKRGHEVTVLAFENKKGLPFFHMDKGVNFINAGEGYTESKFYINLVAFFYLTRDKRFKVRYNIRAKNRGKKILPIINNIKPDIIIAYDVNANCLIKDFFKVKIPVITMFHFDPITLFNAYKGWVLETLKYCECIQVLCNSYVEMVEKCLQHDNVKCIPNIVKQNVISADLENKVIINIARVNREQKRQHIIIEAFNKILKDSTPPCLLSEWKIEIWGETNLDIEYTNELKNLIQKYRLEDKVRFCGTTNNVIKELQRASIFAFPSAYEGFPLAMTEAMSLGIPAVGYKSCPGVNEIINDNVNGILCDDGIDSFAEALKKLMSDYDYRLKLGKQAKKDMEKYAPEIIWDKWENLIREIVANYKNKK